MTEYTATYDERTRLWGLHRPDMQVPVALNADIAPGDSEGARAWVAQVLAEFDRQPDYVGVTTLPNRVKVYATTGVPQPPDPNL